MQEDCLSILSKEQSRNFSAPHTNEFPDDEAALLHHTFYALISISLV